jgi:uncharacterized DUF497 family protein
MVYEWDEAKRLANITKHGLDFVDAPLVYDCPIKLEVISKRNGECRIQAFAYAYEILTVLTLIYLPQAEKVRCISLRRAHSDERSLYHDWLANHEND